MQEEMRPLGEQILRFGTGYAFYAKKNFLSEEKLRGNGAGTSHQTALMGSA